MLTVKLTMRDLGLPTRVALKPYCFGALGSSAERHLLTYHWNTALVFQHPDDGPDLFFPQ